MRPEIIINSCELVRSRSFNYSSLLFSNEADMTDTKKFMLEFSNFCSNEDKLLQEFWKTSIKGNTESSEQETDSC